MADKTKLVTDLLDEAGAGEHLDAQQRPDYRRSVAAKIIEALDGEVRDLGGVITEEPGGIMIETTGAVLPSDFVTSVFQQDLPNGMVLPLIGVQIEGRINRTEEKVRFLLVFDAEGAAAMITGIIHESGRDLEERKPEGDDEVVNSFGAHLRVALDEAHASAKAQEDQGGPDEGPQTQAKGS